VLRDEGVGEEIIYENFIMKIFEDLDILQ